MNTGSVPSLPGKTKSNKDHSSFRLFCIGEPVRMIRWGVRNWEGQGGYMGGAHVNTLRTHTHHTHTHHTHTYHTHTTHITHTTYTPHTHTTHTPHTPHTHIPHTHTPACRPLSPQRQGSLSCDPRPAQHTPTGRAAGSPGTRAVPRR